MPVFQSVAWGGGIVSLAWSAVAGRSYQLEYTTDLNLAVWTKLNGVLTANGSTLTTNDIVGTEAQRFYRVGVVP